MSKQHHPDVSTASLEEAKKKFTDIQRANEVLSDKRRRKMYDMRGEEGLQMLEQHLTSGQQQQQHPFAHLFGGAESSFKGPDAEVRLEVNLVDFFTGGERLLNLKKRKVCPVCRGQGYPADVTMRQCSSCRGQGIIRQRIQFAPGMMQEVQQHCPHCQGRGKVPTHLCHRCHGHRLVDGVSNLHVPVEKGGTEGQAVVFEMEAEEQVDRLPGDLTVRLYSTPHPRFSRRRRHGGPAEDPENNLDLDTILVITLKEALLGFRHTFLHMDEQEEVVVEKSGITAHGYGDHAAGEGHAAAARAVGARGLVRHDQSPDAVLSYQ
ncbi:molecular chaperone DnaJ [Angomonas deanei]|uniref:DnaJ domain/DnaJ C terminal domain/DnaJ central domain containing protein, putative n=1 Tax=Angomonas deanei TaxID=59799 RepID=A0A7G2CAT7_9TRYP|nr:molecular chaperone DnaJ [Angomonas deanei]CAD2216014.1 DnaJ domain/DnaJ C terminal domain/DnaJ central domain containing protein, putative [Angomonas deanei]|eukprot:EPY17468.1 molecular chaperone DnaJ [Angomonas deanei]